MKVSVVIPAFNIENYIKRCLLSVLNQTLKDIEIIVVNDGSTDNTLKVIKEISKNNNRIVVINQNNKGLIEARKSGLNMAKGEYILFVDGDDWLELNALDKLYNNANEYNSDIVLYNAFWSYDQYKEEKNTYQNKKYIKTDPLKAILKTEILPSLCFKLIRRNYIIENKIEFPNNISFGEDLATASSLFMNKPKISTIKECLYNYYQRESSITQSIDERVLEINEAIEFIKNQLIKKDIYNEYKIDFDYMVYVHLYEWKFLQYDKFDYIHKELYKQYVSRNINIYENKYINEKIAKYPRGLKIRHNAYFKGYKIGKYYDKLRLFIKK